MGHPVTEIILATQSGKVTKNCFRCEKEFTRRQQIGKPMPLFCGRRCSAEAHYTRTARECLHCGKEILVNPSRGDRKKYCSKICFWEGKTTATSKTQTCPNCNNDFQVKAYDEFRNRVCCTMRCSFEHNSKLVVGQRIGQLILKERYFKDKISQWICDCDCGVTRSIKSAILMKGITVSCGCYARKGSSIRSLKNNSGDRKGRWLFPLPQGGEVMMRSGFEYMYAECLTKKGIKFEYEAKTFKLASGKHYTPDFYLPETDEYIEVKGFFRPEAQVKVNDFLREINCTLRLVMVGEITDMIGGQGKLARFYREHPPLAA